MLHPLKALLSTQDILKKKLAVHNSDTVMTSQEQNFEMIPPV